MVNLTFAQMGMARVFCGSTGLPIALPYNATGTPGVIEAGLPCYPDCNQTGSLTIADFACFQAAFAAGNAYADCDAGRSLTIADFACFPMKFVQGCP